MDLCSFQFLEEKVRTFDRKILVLAGAQDKHALEGVWQAERDNLIQAVLVGDPTAIMQSCSEIGYSPDHEQILEALSAQDIAEKAVALIKEGVGHFLMKGGLETATLMRACLDHKKGIRTDSTMTHVAVLQVPSYHKLLGITDGGMIPHPTLEQKRFIVHNALDVFRKLGIHAPKAALLSAVETVNPRMPETEDAESLKKQALMGTFGDCFVEGPISLDLAISAQAAAIKGYQSPVAGDADILVCPDIVSGNILAKSLSLLAGGLFAGVIVGATVPIVLSSRSASAQEKHLSILLAASLSYGG